MGLVWQVHCEMALWTPTSKVSVFCICLHYLGYKYNQGHIQGGPGNPGPPPEKKWWFKVFLGLCLHFFCWFYNFSYHSKVCSLQRCGFLGRATTLPTHSKVCNVQRVSHDHMHHYFIQWRSGKCQISRIFCSLVI